MSSSGVSGFAKARWCSRGPLRIRPAEQRRIRRMIHAAVTPRVAAQDPPAGEDAALQQPVATESVDRVLRAARVVLAGPGGREQAEAVPPRRTRGRSRCTSRRHLPEHLADLLHEPFVAAVVGRLGDAGARDEHVVAARAARLRRARCHVSRSWRLSRFRVTALPTDFGTARPRRGTPSGSSSRGNQCSVR